nr:reverse transcriptase domain-containing protein [Tanacetum cinerariifolium]
DLFPPLDNPKLTIQRRSRSDPTLLNNSKMAAKGNDDLPVPDLRTMEELCQPSLNGRGGPIAPIAIQAMNFGLKNDMIQQSIKVIGVTDDALPLYLFPHSLTHHATAWFDRLPKNSINTFEQMAKMFLGPQTQGVLKEDFSSYVKANDAVMRNMQNQLTNLTELLTKFVNSNNESTSSSVSAPRPNQIPSILYQSRLQDQKLRDKANDQREKFFQVFKDLNFNISFADALILMPKFGLSIKSLLANKDKLCELARTPLNKHCSTILLKKLPEKLGDPTLRYSANYNEMTAKRINVIDMACEEYSLEVLGFFDVIASGNPTPYYDLIVSTTSLTLTLFENSDFLFEEVDAFLALEDDPSSPEVNQSYLDSERDILLLEAFLHDDPSLPPPN